MFIEVIFSLMVISIAIELIIAYKVPLWHKWAEKSVLVSLPVSLFLSFYLGKAFGAHGTIVMVAAGGSTVFVVPCYKVVGWWRTNKTKFAEDLASAAQLGRDVGRVIYIIIRFITIPVWGYRGIKLWFHTQKLRFSR